MVSAHRAAGRCGSGCVLGSKNLKAIAARGTKGLKIYDPKAFLETVLEYRDYKLESPGHGGHLGHGSLDLMRRAHLINGLCYRNNQGYLVPEENVKKLESAWWAKHMGVRTFACCPGCGFACGSWAQLKEKISPGASKHAGEWVTKPEFGSINPFGDGCDLPDLPEVSHLNSMCNQYGMDVMEISMTTAFLMELWERGIITLEDTKKWTGEPLSLEWGNSETMEKIIEFTGLRNNELGDMVSGGVYRTAIRIEEIKNVPVLKYANYGKAGATHEGPTRATGLGFSCAVATIGGHHLKGTGVSPEVAQKFLGTADAGESFGLMTRGGVSDGAGATGEYYKSVRGAGQALSTIFKAISDCLGVCYWLCVHSSMKEIPLDLMAKGLGAVTGEKITPQDLLLGGERDVNIQKAFNSRLGLRREDDTVCHRWLNEPLIEGLAAGRKMSDYIERVKDSYYEYFGWDKETALQTKKKLKELDLMDIAGVLAKEAALSGADKGKGNKGEHDK